MLELKLLVKKLYLDKGLTVVDISYILEEPETKIRNIVEQIPNYNTSTSAGDYTFRQLSDEDYVYYRRKSLPIKLMHGFSLEIDLFIKELNLIGIPEIYAMLFYFFGDSSKYYDKYKSSFCYKFLLEFFPKNSEDLAGKYILSIQDIKGGMELEFFKIVEGRNKKDYDKYHKPFPELDKKEMKRIWIWLVVFIKNSLDYFRKNKITIKPFCKKVECKNIIYGYKDGNFFGKSYQEPKNGKEPHDIFYETYEKYINQIRDEVEDTNYRNKSSKFIFELIKETNKSSLIFYEYNMMKSKLFQTCFSYLMSLDYFDRKQVSEKAKSLSSMIIYYLTIEDEFDSIKDFFNKNKKHYEVVNINNCFTFKNFKYALEIANKDLKEAGYTDAEVYLILDNYSKEKSEKKEKERKLLLKTVKKLLEQEVGKNISDTLTKELDKYSFENLNEIIINFRDISDENDVFKIFE